MSELRIRVCDAKDRAELTFSDKGVGEVIVDDEGSLCAAYLTSFDGQLATLEHFVLRDESAGDLVVRRLLQEARFRGASVVNVKAFANNTKAFALAGSDEHHRIAVEQDKRSPYAPKFCEENALLKFREFKNARMVLVSSEARGTPFRFQRATLSPEEPVFWDYHAFVYDLDHDVIVDADCTIAWMLDRKTYLQATFADAPWLAPKYQPYFRLFTHAEAKALKSDRSHMKEQGQWLSPPPSWDPLHSESTLMKALTKDFGAGTLIDLKSFLADDFSSRIANDG